jgi:hypothetical protein
MKDKCGKCDSKENLAKAGPFGTLCHKCWKEIKDGISNEYYEDEFEGILEFHVTLSTYILKLKEDHPAYLKDYEFIHINNQLSEIGVGSKVNIKIRKVE